MNESALVVFLSAVHSGFWGSLCSTPADVVKSRMMADPERYPTVWKTLGKTYAEGTGTGGTGANSIASLKVFWRGFFATWSRLGPWQLCFWLTYETTRSKVGDGGFS